MSKRYFRYLAWHYGRQFVILLLGLSGAVVLIDFLQHMQKIQGGANQKILYLFYTWEYMVSLIYPLVILLALAWTQITLTYRNVFVALFSFGYGKLRLLGPFVTVATLIYLLFLSLHTTDFAYGRDRARAILHHQEEQGVENLFFKYNDTFVFVTRLDPIHKRLYGGKIFRLQGRRVTETVQFDQADYRGESWVAPRATVRRKLFDEEGALRGFKEEQVRDLTLLKGYRPRVFERIYQGRTLTLDEAVSAWRLLARQELSADKIKAILSNKVIMPLFALAMVIILFLKAPVYHRYIRKERLWLLYLGSALLSWALLFALYRLGLNGAVEPLYAQSSVVALLWAYALWLLWRHYRTERAG